MTEPRRSKRKATESAQTTLPAKKVSKSTPTPTSTSTTEQTKPTSSASQKSTTEVGDKIELESFGGEVQTNDGEITSLGKLVEECEKGVVLFTYPKASTPGCTTQVCLFRDSYDSITSAGFSVYGLSADSPKANTTFKTKQKLPYPLLCDPNQTLIKAIGMKKAPKGTTRGVFVVSKEGKVLAMQSGGPAATLEVVKTLLEGDLEKGADEAENGKEEADSETEE